MIQELEPALWSSLLPFICCDNARNYFIRLGLESKRPVYSRIFVEVDSNNKYTAALFERISGNLQFYAESPENFDIPGFSQLLNQLDFKEFIAPASLGDVFLKSGCFSHFDDGAIIAQLNAQDTTEWDSACLGKSNLLSDNSSIFEKVKVADLPDIVGLYLKVFHSFSPLHLMEEKLLTHRGRGILIRKEGQIVAIAQSEFETPNSAVIVGVATLPELQGFGLGTSCMKALCCELRLENKRLSLQYDNPNAGRIYEKLGFKQVDRMRHYIK